MHIASHFETEMYLRNYSVLRTSLKKDMQLSEAYAFEPEDRGFESRWDH